MRDIKFRAFCKSFKKPKLLPVTAMRYLKGLLVSIQVDIGSFIPRNVKPQDTILMQYTGLKDKNGKEIYMDDVVKFRFYDKDYRDSYWGGTAVVTYNMSEGVGLLFDFSDTIQSNAYAVLEGGQLESYWPDEELWEMQVIGNIYENPELLK